MSKKRMIYAGVTTKRLCPTCKRFAIIDITSDGKGWEIWTCRRCKCENHRRVVGGPN